MNVDKLYELTGLLQKVWNTSVGELTYQYTYLRFINTCEDTWYALGDYASGVAFSRDPIIAYDNMSYYPMESYGYPASGWRLLGFPWREKLLNRLKWNIAYYKHHLNAFENAVAEIKSKDYVRVQDADRLHELRKRLYGTTLFILGRFSFVVQLPSIHLQFESLDKSHYLWYPLSNDRLVVSRQIPEINCAYEEAINLAISPGRANRGKYRLIANTSELIMNENRGLGEVEKAAWDLIDEIENLLNEEAYNGI